MRNFGKISINEGNNMTVNQKIRIMRKERNITTTVLSEKIGISQSSVVRYENGSVKYVPLDLLDKMAEVFGCSVDDLIEGDSRYTQKKNRAKSKQLSEDEQNLLVKFRELSAKEKNAVIGLCDLLINH
jgi:DNA-binding Xre family transcriptional regulator